MQIAPVQTTVPSSPPNARNEAAGGASTFASALGDQRLLDAARGVLTTLPAPIVYSLRDRPGSPADAVDRLFSVLKDGSFTPPAGPLGQPGSIIGATAHAATLFDTPAQLWEAMRAAIADPGAATPFAAGPPAEAAPAGAGTAEPLPEVRTLEDAERLLTQLRAAPVAPSTPPLATAAGAPHPVPMSARDADWWDAALRFLLGASFPA